VARSGLQPDDVAAAHARGRAAFPALDLDQATFAAHAARVAAGASVSALAAEDLFLASACLAGVPGAAAAFAARYGATIRGAIARIVRGADAADVEQRFIDTMLVAPQGSSGKLGAYGGRAALGRWLSVAAQRAALGWVRSHRAESNAREGAAAERELVGGSVGVETGYLKERYRATFEEVFKEALARRPERERMLLRLHLVNGVRVDQIGKMFQVSQPTASRWLAAAREAVLDDVKATLGSRLGIGSDELAALAGLVASRLDLSLSHVLG
jgi:RNA polymerase sigma-70 factor (ECF subfamily)